MVDAHATAFLWRITAAGDATVVVPVICGAAVALWIAGQREAARALALAFVLCAAATVASKLVLMVFYRGGPLRSPSGHAAISAFFYGSIALLVWRSGISRLARAAFAIACLALIGLIAVSRFEIGGHSRTETAVGLLFGFAAAVFLDRRFNWVGRTRVAVPALAAGVAVAVVAHGVLAQGYFDEERIWAFALWLRGVAFRA